MLSNSNFTRVRSMFNNENSAHTNNQSSVKLNISNIALPQNIGF